MTFGFFPYASAPFADTGQAAEGQSINVNLTGVAAVGVVGDVAVSSGQTIDLTGLNAVGQVGTVTVEADSSPYSIYCSCRGFIRSYK